MKKLFNLLIFFAVFFSACNKFEEGPAISLRSKLSRIEGTWKVEKFYVNDVDSTDLYYQVFGCEIKFTNEVLINGKYVVQLISCNNGKTLNGNWRFRHRDSSAPYNAVEFSGFPIDTSFNFIIGMKSMCYDTVPNSIWGLYEIRRLTNRELILERGRWNNLCNKIKRIELKKE